MNIRHLSTLRSGLHEPGNANPCQRHSSQRNLLELTLSALAMTLPMIPVLLGCLIAIIPATLQGEPEDYTEPQLYGMRPNPNDESEMGPIGATGIEARIYKGVKVTVEAVHPDTPAFGKFGKGDVILGVNGEKLVGEESAACCLARP